MSRSGQLFAIFYGALVLTTATFSTSKEERDIRWRHDRWTVGGGTDGSGNEYCFAAEAISSNRSFEFIESPTKSEIRFTSSIWMLQQGVTTTIGVEGDMPVAAVYGDPHTWVIPMPDHARDILTSEDELWGKMLFHSEVVEIGGGKLAHWRTAPPLPPFQSAFNKAMIDCLHQIKSPDESRTDIPSQGPGQPATSH